MLRPGRVLRLTLTAIVGLSTPALAHTLRVSTGEFRVEGKEVTGVLQFARAELDAIRHEELAPSIEVQAKSRPCRSPRRPPIRSRRTGWSSTPAGFAPKRRATSGFRWAFWIFFQPDTSTSLC